MGRFLMGIFIAILLCLLVIFGIPGMMQAAGVDPQAGQVGHEAGNQTVYKSEGVEVQGQSGDVQDSIAQTAVAADTCQKLNNCFAPDGYTKSGNMVLVAIVVAIIMIILFGVFLKVILSD